AIVAFPWSLAACTNSALVHFDDCFADRETEPETFATRIRLFERIKNSFDKLWFDAHAAVIDLDGDRRCVRIVRPHGNRAVFWRTPLHTTARKASTPIEFTGLICEQASRSRKLRLSLVPRCVHE